MRYAVVLTLVVVLAGTGCNESKADIASPRDVTTVLRNAHLKPRRLTVTLSVSTGKPTNANVPFTQAVQQSSPDAMVPVGTIDTDGGRAFIIVFADTGAARTYAEVFPRSMRVRNVVAIPAETQHLSRRLRAALLRLR